MRNAVFQRPLSKMAHTDYMYFQEEKKGEKGTVKSQYNESQYNDKSQYCDSFGAYQVKSLNITIFKTAKVSI